jgi:hypothetical protein
MRKKNVPEKDELSSKKMGRKPKIIKTPGILDELHSGMIILLGVSPLVFMIIRIRNQMALKKEILKVQPEPTATTRNANRVVSMTPGLVSPSPDRDQMMEIGQSDIASVKGPFSDAGVKSHRKRHSKPSSMSVHNGTSHQISEIKERKQRFSKVSNMKVNISDGPSIGFEEISHSRSTAFVHGTKPSFPHISKSSFPQSDLQLPESLAGKFSTQRRSLIPKAPTPGEIGLESIKNESIENNSFP